MMKKLKKLISFALLTIIIGAVTIFLIDSHVKKEGAKYIVKPEAAPKVDAVLVLGAAVFRGGIVSPILSDRLDTALELYNKNKADKFLLTGDHGQVNYDEVNAMKNYIEEQNVESKNIFLDHAGFSTYESMYRAKEIFKVKKVIIVTQGYHLMRSVYLARKMGIEAYGVASDKRQYINMDKYKMREVAARCKDFVFVNILKPEPKYLGKTIPISGDGRITHDKLEVNSKIKK
ncbi:SanA/YdcF family protein [Clostridium ganghwense]|uniref:YdcF family protein n=1 Tax=Clostridium ganghwense TaxID=312089 RepID=A0ABT4CNU5_9CLOT|nr:ElyC/SanA/YdcF family protein [Clostridium ganghwense]MCY6370731.1 YdcF family protein [Clostridium ganghwense]